MLTRDPLISKIKGKFHRTRCFGGPRLFEIENRKANFIELDALVA